jgi:hypothetical protein
MKIKVVKEALARIKIAQNQDIKQVIIPIKKKVVSLLLNILWDTGRLYGYIKISARFYLVFLKYNTNGKALIKNVLFDKTIFKYRKLCNVHTLDGNVNYIILTPFGCYLSNFCLLYRLGGLAIVKLF